MNTLMRAALAALALSLTQPAAAQDYPSRQVRIIVPFGAGGPADVYARVIAQHLSEELKQTFIVEDRPGAGSIIGTDAVAKSPPDGYTLLLMSNTHTTNESLVRNKPFELMRDFVPVATLNYSDLIMVVHPSVPAKDLKEFIALAKKEPGKMNYGSSGPGTPYHMAGELFKYMSGTNIVHVPHKASGEMRSAVIGGHVQMAFDAFLSLVPLAAFAGWMLFTFHQKSGSITLIFGPILRASPEAVSELVSSEFLRLSDSGAAAVAPISLLVFLWVTSSGLATAMGVFETMYARTPRPWLRRRVLAIGFVLLGVTSIAAVGTVALMVVRATNDAFGRWLAVFLAIGMVFLLVYLFYRFSVSTRERRRKTRYLVPGALLTIVLWAATSVLFSLYVTRLSRYATLYGNLATVAILLFWLWLLSLSLLVGAEVNAELEKAAMRRAGEPTTSRPSQW